MAYRFNPPPNWPVEEPGWTPPPGWQPDPSWGPAPEGWNFWVEEGASDAAGAGGAVSGQQEVSAVDDDLTTLRSDRSDEHPLEVFESSTDVDAPTRASGPRSAEPSSTTDPLAAESTAPDPLAPQPSPAGEASSPAGPSADPLAPGSETGDPGAGPSSETPSSAPETLTSDLESDMRTEAPYETQAPAPSYGSASEASGQGVDQGASAAPAYGAAAASYGSPAPAQDSSGYGSASYGSPAPAQDSSGYGAGSYGASAPEPGYGTDAPSYGSPAYGQASPAAFGSPAEQGSWQAAGPSGIAQDKPQKGFLARFWWLGCIILAIVALVLATVGFFVIRGLSGGGDDQPTDGQSSASTASASSGPASTDPATTDPATTDPAATPVAQPVIDPAAQEQPIASSQGTGAAQVQMQWMTADQLPSQYGGTIDPGTNPEYLVVTAKVRVDEGKFSINPFNFAVVTPYGGAIDPATETFGLADSGIDSGSSDVLAGQEHTIRMVYDVQKNPGLKLQYDTYDNQYTWDVPV